MTVSSIVQNPFRILGVYSNSPTKERLANKNRITAFLRVGKHIEFPSDFPTFIPPVSRTKESLLQAESQLNLPEDILRHALFWFIKNDNFDEIGLNHLEAGNIFKAKEIFSKRNTFSSNLNLAIIDFIESKYSLAIKKIFSILQDTQFRNSLIESVCDNKTNYSEKELIILFNEALCDEFGVSNTLEIYANCEDIPISALDSVRNKLGSSISSRINNLIQNSEELRNAEDISTDFLKEAINLKNNAVVLISDLEKHLSKNSSHYQLSCDHLARELNQLIIAAINSDGKKESLNLNDCRDILLYAKEKALSELVIKDISQTLNTLELEEISKICTQERQEINDAIAMSIQKGASIDEARYLLATVEPVLSRLEWKLGKENKFFVVMSSSVIKAVSGMVIKAVNDLEKQPAKRIIQNGSFETTISSALYLLKQLDTLECEPILKRHLNENILMLERIDNQITAARGQAYTEGVKNYLLHWLYRIISLFIIFGLIWIFD